MIKKTTRKIISTKAKTKVSKKETVTYDVVVVGGGPAGLMAAGTAAKDGAKVFVIEKNEELGKKLLISGGGRCNLTNANPNHRDFVSKYGKKGNFLFTPFSIFSVNDSIKFFNDLGLKTKVEPGFRVFPESNSSLDVLEILVRYAKNNGVEFMLSMEVDKFKKVGEKITSVILKNGEEIKAKSFVLATGGKSHPETGSTGDGFKWLKELGHKVADSNPSLVPIKIKEIWIGDFAGITLENVGISVWQDSKKIINKKGRILFTHEGASGPTILNMSKDIGDLLQYGETKIAIDFFPGIGLDELHERFKKLFELHSSKKIKNLIINEVPAKIFLKILDLLKIDGEIWMNSIMREERTAIIDKLKKFELRVSGLMGYDKAIISSGGLDLEEVDFRTMKSKLFDNLFFVGDLLDFDRPSGGFSLQLCWTTGYIAGKNSVSK
jgi:predicted Rossmann fold flavoprotein